MNKQNSSGGVSFLGLLALLFIGLKLANVITWSWFYVLLPITAPLLIAGFFLLAAALIGVGIAIVEGVAKAKAGK